MGRSTYWCWTWFICINKRWIAWILRIFSFFRRCISRPWTIIWAVIGSFNWSSEIHRAKHSLYVWRVFTTPIWIFRIYRFSRTSIIIFRLCITIRWIISTFKCTLSATQWDIVWKIACQIYNTSCKWFYILHIQTKGAKMWMFEWGNKISCMSPSAVPTHVVGKPVLKYYIVSKMLKSTT